MKLDDGWLASLGLGALDPAEKRALLRCVVEELELRVGRALAAGLTEGQLEEFAWLMEADDQRGALAWLERSAPRYEDVVRGEVSRLEAELRAGAARLLAQAG